ncbi:MAG: TolC family protein [Saprospiraceae bacterium]
MKINHPTALLLALFLMIGKLNAQPEALKNYIGQALDQNIALQQKNLSYQRSLEALKEAKALFFPKLSFDARYSAADGGRTIDFPIGDLMNPVYDNLNLINGLASDANPNYPNIPAYPRVENESINFLRTREQETRIRAAMPLFNAAIIQNQQIQENLSETTRIGVEVYKKELVKEVKIAYFNYAKAVQAIRLFENTMDLVNENLRTSESLYRNHKVTIDEVYAAQAQVKQVEQELAVAQKNENVAKAYFNFLLNQDFETPISLQEETIDPIALGTKENLLKSAQLNREEIQQMNYYLAATDNKIKLSKGNRLPSVNLAIDYGVQGTNYNLDAESDYVMGSLVLNWNLFDRSNRPKVQQAKIEKEEIGKRKEEIQRQIGLQTISAFHELEASFKQIELADAQVTATEQAYKLVAKKYALGQTNQVELTNARTQLTNAQQQLLLTRYDFQIKQAELERATGTYSFN